MKKITVLLLILAAVALPLFAQSIVEKKDLEPDYCIAATVSADYMWQYGPAETEGPGMKIEAYYANRNGLNIGLDVSANYYTGNALTVGPDVISLFPVIGLYRKLDNTSGILVKAGPGVKIAKTEEKTYYLFSVEVGEDIIVSLSDTIALSFGTSATMSLSPSGDNKWGFSIKPDFGINIVF